jgi:hypothetical protein
MLSNSEFIVMLNQAATDRIELAKLLNISNEQLSYITNVDAGHGLLKVGSNLVPFENKFPRDTKLYSLMTSKPGEGFFGSSNQKPGSGLPNKQAGSEQRVSAEEEAEFMRRIQEVAKNNDGFGELVKKYMGQNGQ